MITTAKSANIATTIPRIKIETKRLESINLFRAVITITPLTRKNSGELSSVHLTGGIWSAFEAFIAVLFRTHDLFDIVHVPCHRFGDFSKAAVTINNNIQH